MQNLTIVGNVGRDPEMKGANAVFSVGVKGWSDRPTTWYNVSVGGKRAEVVMKYIKKGSSVTVNGSYQFSFNEKKNDAGEVVAQYFNHNVFANDFTFSSNSPKGKDDAIKQDFGSEADVPF